MPKAIDTKNGMNKTVRERKMVVFLSRFFAKLSDFLWFDLVFWHNIWYSVSN